MNLTSEETQYISLHAPNCLTLKTVEDGGIALIIVPPQTQQDPNDFEKIYDAVDAWKICLTYKHHIRWVLITADKLSTASLDINTPIWAVLIGYAKDDAFVMPDGTILTYRDFSNFNLKVWTGTQIPGTGLLHTQPNSYTTNLAFQSAIVDLQTKYDKLQAKHDTLQAKYDMLQARITDQTLAYTKLNSELDLATHETEYANNKANRQHTLISLSAGSSSIGNNWTFVISPTINIPVIHGCSENCNFAAWGSWTRFPYDARSLNYIESITGSLGTMNQLSGGFGLNIGGNNKNIVQGSLYFGVAYVPDYTYSVVNTSNLSYSLAGTTQLTGGIGAATFRIMPFSWLGLGGTVGIRSFAPADSTQIAPNTLTSWGKKPDAQNMGRIPQLRLFGGSVTFDITIQP